MDRGPEINFRDCKGCITLTSAETCEGDITFRRIREVDEVKRGKVGGVT